MAPAPAHAPIGQLLGAVRRRLPAGSVIAMEGDPPRTLGLVESGCVTLWASVPSGRRAVVQLLGPGGVFGADSICAVTHPDGTPSGVSALPLPEVRTLTPARLLTAPGWRAAVALREHPEAAGWLAGRLATQAADLAHRLRVTLTLPLGERVLAVLCDLGRTHGRAVPDGTRIALPLTQDLLASMCGATRESVNRALRDLGAAGLVAWAGRTYVLAPRGPGGSGRTDSSSAERS